MVCRIHTTWGLSAYCGRCRRTPGGDLQGPFCRNYARCTQGSKRCSRNHADYPGHQPCPCASCPQKRGIWLVGTSDVAPASLYLTDLAGPLALVMGSEGDGLRRLTGELCDYLVNIPMAGQVESLNVSVASGVCLYEINRQREIR